MTTKVFFEAMFLLWKVAFYSDVFLIDKLNIDTIMQFSRLLVDGNFGLSLIILSLDK